MDQRLIKFLHIIGHGSFTKAARATNVSQPALSLAIKSLEKDLGAKLFLPGIRPLQLTEAGELVHESSERIRAELTSLQQHITRTTSKQKPQSLIGSIDSVATQLLRSKRFSQHMTIHVDNSSRLMQHVQSGELDFALITEPAIKPSPPLIIKNIYEEQFALVTSPAHYSRVVKQLKEQNTIQNFITYNPTSTTYRLIVAACEIQHINLDISFRSTSPELMRHVAIQGHGTALLPKTLVQDDITNGVLKIVSGCSFARPIALITTQNARPSVTRSSDIKAIIKLLSQNSAV